MSPAEQHLAAPHAAAAAAAAASGSDDYHNAASTSDDKLRDISDKYYMVIAHFLSGSGNVNGTVDFDNFNGPLLKASVKSVYWLFLIQYAALALLGIILNIVIIVYIMYHRLYKDVTHAFIINLAFCHFIQCALVLPVSLMVMLIQNWIFGQFLCFFLPMLQDIPLHVAMISHILIAWDRMRWLNDPLKGRLPGFVCCCATWLTGMVIALPYPIYTFYLELGRIMPQLAGIGLCVVNLMDDMHEYTRGLFLLMYCGPAILLSYLYIRTSQELRPPDGPFAVMMYEHRADLRIRQRLLGAPARRNPCIYPFIRCPLSLATLKLFHFFGGATHPQRGGVAGLSNGNSTANRSYDLYSAELDVHRERRKQRNFGSMAATQVVCVCPLMILRFARFSLEETYENQKHFDFTYLMFVWIAFLPTVIFPCIYASQILPRDEQERLRGYFRLSSKRKTKARRSDAGTTSREDSIEKDEHTNTTSIAGHGPAQLQHEAPKQQSQVHSTSLRHERGSGQGPGVGTSCGERTRIGHKDNRDRERDRERQRGGRGHGAGDAGVVNNLGKQMRSKKHDVKINIISDGSQAQGRKHMLQHSGSNSNNSSRLKATQARHKLATDCMSTPNDSVPNLTASNYFSGNNNNSVLLDDSSTSNYGDGEESSVVSSMIHTPQRWPLRHKDISFSECSSTYSSSTLERDLEIIDLLERERSMDIQEMLQREQHGEKVRPTVGRQLPDIEKLYAQRSPKAKRSDCYGYDKAALALVMPGSDPLSLTLSCSSSSSSSSTSQPTEYSLSSAQQDQQHHHHQQQHHHHHHQQQQQLQQQLAMEQSVVGNSTLTEVQEEEEEVPEDFYDSYTPGGSNTLPTAMQVANATAAAAAAAAAAATPVYQYQYTRRLSRKSSSVGSHHVAGVGSTRNSKRDSFNSLNGTDLIAGTFCELDPTQPLNKMTGLDGRMRRSSPRNASFGSSSARSSLKSRDYGHGSTHSAHPELDFRENIFAEL